jgi:hypothetical protein
MTLRPLFGLALAAALAGTAVAQPPVAVGNPDDPTSRYPNFQNLVKGAKEFDGLFHMYLKDDRLLAEIQPQQFDRPFLFSAAIAKGAGVGGTTLVDDEAWVLYFKRVGERVFLVRKNTRFRATPGTPAGRATDVTYSDSVLAALPIRTLNPMRGSVVVDFNQIFFTDFAQLDIGFLDPSRTTWDRIKAFKKNVELRVAATFTGGRRGRGNDDVIDSRGVSVILHYSLIELPDFGYTPRVADDRVGHFISVVKDFNGAETKDTAFVRYVNRWRLERADGTPWKEGGKLSPPKKRIVFWIENTVPDEYRAAVREGILEWNKAFEKVGFKDAIEVRQQENEEFDPEDVTYATFRWVTNEKSFAIGPSRVNPTNGEIIDADILFDASMVRYEKANYRVYRNERGEAFEPASDIQAGRRGWMIPGDPLAALRAEPTPGSWNDRSEPISEEESMRRKLNALRHGYCQCAAHKGSELGLAILHHAATFGLKEGEKVPDELLQQAVKETVMHEVGHTLGLRHNFKASTVIPNDKLHDKAATAKGLVGSVMDYNPANIAPKGTPQGYYFTPTLGAYDFWAIEYAYRPNANDEELAKIASKAADPALIYGTDEDLIASADPLVNQWDLGNDPLKFAMDRVKVTQDLLPKLADTAVDKGEGYQRLRTAFDRLLRQYGNAAALSAKFVGGEALYRDHKGDPNARDPFVPVAAAKQREALRFLQEQVLTDKPFDFPPDLLRKLAADRWLHWGNEGAMRAVDYPLNARVLGIQRVALDELFDPATLRRVQDIAHKAPKGEDPLAVADIFRAVTESVFCDLPAAEKPGDKAPVGKSSVIRRNLQRAYLSRLAGMVLGPKSGGNSILILLGGGSFGGGPVPADAKSLARMHLREIGKRIDAGLKAEKDDAVRAHLEEAREQIAKVLSASLTANEP